MALKVVYALTLFSILTLEVKGQIPGVIGDRCMENNLCIDKYNQVCDTNDSPPKCKIRAEKGCGQQPSMCVLGASCQGKVCKCTVAPQDNGLCQPQVTTSAGKTTMPTTEEAGGDVTSAVTETPTTTTTVMPSGAVDRTSTFLTLAATLTTAIAVTLLSKKF